MAASWPEMVNEAPPLLNGEAEGPTQGLSCWQTAGLTWICGVGLNPQMSVYGESMIVWV